MLNIRTAVHSKHLEGGRDREVLESLVGEIHRVHYPGTHLAELGLGEVPDDSIQEQQEMFGHTESGRRRDSKNVVGGHVEVVVAAVVVAAAVRGAANSTQAGMRTRGANDRKC